MVKLRIADNTEVKCPVADVIIKTGNNTYQIGAAIVRQLPANALLGRDVLLGKGVPLLECTLERMETDEIKQTLRRISQKGELNPKAIIVEASREVCISCRNESSKDQEVRGGGSNEEPGE